MLIYREEHLLQSSNYDTRLFISYESFWKQNTKDTNRLVWKSRCSQPASWLGNKIRECRTDISVEFSDSEVQQDLLSILIMWLQDIFYSPGSWFMMEWPQYFQTTHWDDGMKLKCVVTSACCSTQSMSISTIFLGKGMFAMISINKRPTVPFVFCIMLRSDLSTNSFNFQKYVKTFLSLFYKGINGSLKCFNNILKIK